MDHRPVGVGGRVHVPDPHSALLHLLLTLTVDLVPLIARRLPGGAARDSWVPGAVPLVVPVVTARVANRLLFLLADLPVRVHGGRGPVVGMTEPLLCLPLEVILLLLGGRGASRLLAHLVLVLLGFVHAVVDTLVVVPVDGLVTVPGGVLPRHYVGALGRPVPGSRTAPRPTPCITGVGT